MFLTPRGYSRKCRPSLPARQWSFHRGVGAAGILLALPILVFRPACAAPDKPLKFWNVTAATITELYLEPVGTSHWSANLCLSDPDHTVEADERISMNGIVGGQYNVRVVDEEKRSCVFHNMTVNAGGPYALSISEIEMKSCR